VVLCNFADTYSFILQDEAQGVCWNCAIHPFVIYVKKKSDALNTEIKPVVVYDCNWNMGAIHLRYQMLQPYLLE
jgi:hypothetical protein